MNATKTVLLELTKTGDFGRHATNCSTAMTNIKSAVCEDLKACKAEGLLCNYFSFLVDAAMTRLGACDIPLATSLEVFAKIDKLL
jgi:hypothetical protein